MSSTLTDIRSTATTYATAHTTTTTHTSTSTTPARPRLLHPPRPPSRNKILCEFAQSQNINSYGSWRFTASSADYDEPTPKDIGSDGSRPASPISSSSSSERDDRLGDSTGSPSSHVLRARASTEKENNSLGSSWGVSSIGKSFDWTWNASDDIGGASDADTEPTDEDDAPQDMQEQEQEKQKSSPPPRLTTSESSNRAFGFHSLGSPLSAAQTPKNNSNFDLSPLRPYTYTYTQNLHISPLVPRITSITTMTASDPSPLTPNYHSRVDHYNINSPVLQSPVHSRPISPLVSPSISRAPSSTGSTTSSRFRRRSSQKRISLIAGRVSFTPPPSPPLIDTNTDDLHGDGGDDDDDHQRSPRLLRLNSTSSFMSLASTVATAPPTPAGGPGTGTALGGDYLGERSISEFVIQGDVGRGAYGLVKRGREVMSNGSYGVSFLFNLFFLFSSRLDTVASGLSPHRISPLA